MNQITLILIVIKRRLKLGNNFLTKSILILLALSGAGTLGNHVTASPVLSGPYHFTENETLYTPTSYGSYASVVYSGSSTAAITSEPGVQVSIVNTGIDPSDSLKWNYGIDVQNGGIVALDKLSITGSYWAGLITGGASSNVTLGDKLYISTYQNDGSYQSYGIRNDGGSIDIGNSAYISAPGVGLYITGDTGTITIGDNAFIQSNQVADGWAVAVAGGSFKAGNNGILKTTGLGLLAHRGGNIVVGDNTVVDAFLNGPVEDSLSGLYAVSKGHITTGSQLQVNSEGYAVYASGADSLITLGDGAHLEGDTIYDDDSGNMSVVKTTNTASIILSGADITQKSSAGKGYSIASTNYGSVSGVGVYNISGDMTSLTGASIDLTMNNTSTFTGSTVKDTASIINFDMSNSTWNVSGNSAVSKLSNNNSTINMLSDNNQNSTLTIDSYASNNGRFIMNTDLASETDGDKVYITTSNMGTTFIAVSDASIKNNTPVSDIHKLLLVTDASQKGTFVGTRLNTGGLWTVTPTIENGLQVGGAADQWYLTLLTKNLNESALVLQDTSHNQYALWRTSMDTYRERKSALRDELDKGNGIWARYKGGSFDVHSKNNNYNIFQLGYDKALTNQWTLGASLERAQGNSDYAVGSGTDKMWAGTLYGTWTPNKGSYTDIVLKYGEINSDIRSYGEYPDNASYSTKGYSLGVEHGKRFILNKDNGTYIEPQAQLTWGQLSSTDYTTNRGTQVHSSKVNSLVGRIGVMAGKTISKGDVYVKANLLHEFNGNQNISMTAANGETLQTKENYGGTWVELGIGTNLKINDTAKFYADISKGFGSDIKKKWQVNAGVSFTY